MSVLQRNTPNLVERLLSPGIKNQFKSFPQYLVLCNFLMNGIRRCY